MGYYDMDKIIKKTTKVFFKIRASPRPLFLIKLPNKEDIWEPKKDSINKGLPCWVALQGYRKMGMQEYVLISLATIDGKHEVISATHYTKEQIVNYRVNIRQGKYKPYLELPWEKSIVQPKNMYNPRFNAFASIESVAEWYKPIFRVPEKRIELLKELVDGACDAMINPSPESIEEMKKWDKETE